MSLGLGNVQRAILNFLRERPGTRMSSVAIAREVFGDAPSIAARTSTRRALAQLRARGLVVRDVEHARWQVPREPKPKPRMRKPKPYKLKYRSTGKPTHRDELPGQQNLFEGWDRLREPT